MAFSQRARRPGAFSAGAAAAKGPSPEEAFAGAWVDDDGAVVTIQGSKIKGPDGSFVDLDIKSATSCSFTADGESYEGTLSNGRISWSDGCVWVRKTDAAPAPRQQTAEERARLQVEEEAKAEEEVRQRRVEESRRQREEQRKKTMEEAKRRAAAMAEDRVEEEQAAAASAGAAQEADADDAEKQKAASEVEAMAAAKAKMQAGMDRAKAAFEAEKARKAAALERARAAKAAAQEAAEDEAKASERSRKEKEEAAAAVASTAAPAGGASAGSKEQDATGEDVAAAKAKSQAGIDRARQAFEAEKARKAAALERARAAKAAAEAGSEPAAQAATDAEDKRVTEAKAKSQSGIDRAKAAFEAEKARKAAAMERVRAEKAAAEKATAEKAAAEELKATPSEDPEAAAKAKSQAGLDRARAAFEAEKARKAAALERVRKQKAEAEAAAAAQGSESASDAAAPKAPAEADPNAAAKAKSQAGLDKARAAFEAEKARKAAALERARAAKAAAEAEAAAAEAEPEASTKQSRPSRFQQMVQQKAAPPQPTRSRPSAFEQSMPQAESAPVSKRPSAFEAAQAKASSSSEPATKRPSAFEAAASASREPAGKRPSAFEAAQSQARRSPAEEPRANLSPELEPGTVVRLHDLVARSDLNGLLGELVQYKADAERWEVAVEGMGETHCNLRATNMTPITQEEFDAWQEEQERLAAEQQAQEIDVESMVKSVSGEAMRWMDTLQGKVVRSPGPTGNENDISIAHNRHGDQVAMHLGKTGVCVCEANAGFDLLMAAYSEAKAFWDAGEFTPPMQDMGASELEAALWERVLYQDEKKALWINEMSEKAPRMEALQVIAQNMKHFAESIQEPLARRMGITFSHMWDGMVAGYSGKRNYNFHLDNPHSLEENSLPDNGLRLSLVFYLNPHWSPEANYNGGGLDLFLTNPTRPPESGAAARSADRLRIAPHADTLAVFLSQRMAHQVISTEGMPGEDPWFAVWLWCFEEEAMGSFPMKVLEQRGIAVPQQARGADGTGGAPKAKREMDDLDDGSDVVALDNDDDELSEVD